jgi:hypothetical protein
MAAQCPAAPVAASRCPGRGLAAGVTCRVRPSGYRTMLCRKTDGFARAAGAPAAHRRIGDPHGQRQRQHRCGHGEHGTAQRLVTAAATTPYLMRGGQAERDREQDHAGERDPQPRVAGHAGKARRPEQPEHGHRGQVRIIGPPGRELPGPQVRAAVPQQQRRGTAHDLDVGCRGRADGQPGQWGRQGAGRAGQQRRVPPPRAAGRHRGDRGQQVATRRPDPPGLVRVPAEDRQQRGIASERRVPRPDLPPVQPGHRIKPRLAGLRRVQADYG